MRHFYLADKPEYAEKTHVYSCPVCDKDNRGTAIHETISIVSFTESKQQIIVLYCRGCFSSEAPEELDQMVKDDPSIDVHKLFEYAYLKGRIDMLDLVRSQIK